LKLLQYLPRDQLARNILTGSVLVLGLTRLWRICHSRGLKIKGSICIITGASSGIGRATAKAMADKGGNVILLARSEDLLQKAVQEIKESGGNAKYYVVDCSNAAQVAKVAHSIRSEFGTPDILVNNAGAGQWKWIDETSAEDVVNYMGAPYFAAFFMTKEFLKGMSERGTGSIVFVNSPACDTAWPSSSAYASARHALRGFARSIAMDTWGSGVNTHHLMLGDTDSDYWKNNPGSREKIPWIAKLISPSISSETAANVIIAAVECNKKNVVYPFTLNLVYRMYVGPMASLIDWMIIRTGAKQHLK